MTTYTQQGLFETMYGGLPPHQKHSDTSKMAALALDGTRRATLRAAVYRYVLSHGGDGATDQEIQNALDMNGNTERPRRRELEQAGLVIDSKQRRKTDAGKDAVVWTVVP